MSLRNHRKKETEEYPEHRENFGQKSCTMSTFPHEVSGNTSVCWGQTWNKGARAAIIACATGMIVYLVSESYLGN